MAPVSICLATRTIAARLVIRETPPGQQSVYPLLVVDKCPWTPAYRAGHGHVHVLTEAGPRQWKVPTCNHQPYVINLERSA